MAEQVRAEMVANVWKVVVAQGDTAPRALRKVRSARWQALPNDRQLAALLDFEAQWRREHG